MPSVKKISLAILLVVMITSPTFASHSGSSRKLVCGDANGSMDVNINDVTHIDGSVYSLNDGRIIRCSLVPKTDFDKIKEGKGQLFCRGQDGIAPVAGHRLIRVDPLAHRLDQIVTRYKPMWILDTGPVKFCFRGSSSRWRHGRYMSNIFVHIPITYLGVHYP